MATWTIASSFEISVGTVTAATIVVGSLAGKDGSDAPSIHSGLTLDDGTNPHGTTKSDVGLSNVPNTDFTSAVAANTAKVSLEDGSVTIAKAAATYKTRVTANVVTSYAIDRNAGSTFELTMTGACTFTDSNLASGTNTEVISIILDGNFVPTFPVYWEATPSSDSYSGAVRNLLVVETVNGTGGSEDIIYSLENLTT